MSPCCNTDCGVCSACQSSLCLLLLLVDYIHAYTRAAKSWILEQRFQGSFPSSLTKCRFSATLLYYFTDAARYKPQCAKQHLHQCTLDTSIFAESADLQQHNFNFLIFHMKHKSEFIYSWNTEFHSNWFT